VCPKCGEPGTGEGIVRNERRFFHNSSQSCYLGMVDPIRKKEDQIKCPKCGGDGRKSVSKGYAYIRHANKTCYVGKPSLLTKPLISIVEPSEVLTKPLTVKGARQKREEFGLDTP
jgi:hypothetical protein